MTEQWDARRGSPAPHDVARLLPGVPEWSGREDVNTVYIRAAREMEAWTVRDAAGTVVGVTPVVWYFPDVAGAHSMVVERGHHGHGVGRATIEAFERDAQGSSARLLTVKILGPSHPNPGYTRTRRFYEQVDFLPFEEIHLWGKGTPRLIMVEPLTGWIPTTGVD